MRLRTLLALLALVPIGAGCGAATGGGSTGPDTSAASAPATTTPPAAAAGIGAGAAFTPAGSLLYVRTPGTGPAWDALGRMRARVHGIATFDPAAAGDIYLRLVTGSDFAGGPAVLQRSLVGESSEALISDRTFKEAGGMLASDSFFYSAVKDHDAVERWIAASARLLPADGAYALFAVKDGGGYSALSTSAWLWAPALQPLHEAIATAAGGRPSLLSDQAFRAAFAAVDTRAAAVVGYSRGDLESELSHIWAPALPADRLLTGLTGTLGLADAAFAVGANAHGIWLRAAPHAAGYHPGTAFTPALLDRVPHDAFVYLGAIGGAAELHDFDRVLAPLSTGSGGDPPILEKLLTDDFGLPPSCLAVLGDGEQAWYFGPTTGVLIHAADPSRDEGILQRAARAAIGRNLTAGADGSVVWMRSAPSSGPAPAGPGAAALVADAQIGHPVSWIGAVNLSILRGLGAAPDHGVDGVVLATAPGTGGRYRLDVYLGVG